MNNLLKLPVIISHNVFSGLETKHFYFVVSKLVGNLQAVKTLWHGNFGSGLYRMGKY